MIAAAPTWTWLRVIAANAVLRYSIVAQTSFVLMSAKNAKGSAFCRNAFGFRFDAGFEIQKQQVGEDDVSVFDLLHVLGFEDNGAVEQFFHLSAAKARKAHGGCTGASGKF
jgi:hypothetical protein